MMYLLARFARSAAITNICACFASVNCGPRTAVAGVVGEYFSGRYSFPGLSFPHLSFPGLSSPGSQYFRVLGFRFRSIQPLRFQPVNRLSVWEKSEKSQVQFLVSSCNEQVPPTWAKFGGHSKGQSCSRRRLEQLLRLFRAIQTSHVLNIPTYVIFSRIYSKAITFLVCVSFRRLHRLQQVPFRFGFVSQSTVSLMRQRTYAEISSTREVWRARKRRKSYSKPTLAF